VTRIGEQFVRSSRCDNAACLEVAHRVGTVLVRDSKQGESGPELVFAPADWGVFLAEFAGRSR
jgi:hypothetical protein